MDYTNSLPQYMDPANWQHQQQNPQTGIPGAPLVLPTPPQPHGSGSIRPGSMADRARMANIPMQEVPQKCPRCESTNTKFCYFNNYNLSQPRHFCKTCRRYWTRGGALRNVPVGGGCRRNKRTKGSSGGSSSKSVESFNSQVSRPAADMAGIGGPARFIAPPHQLGEIGLNYGLMSSPVGGVGELNFNIGSSLGTGATSGGGSLLSSTGLEQWRMTQTHQFPFLSGLEVSSSHGLSYPFEGGGTNSVKMEENQELSLSRQFMGINNNNNSNNNPASEQYWSSAGAASTSP